MSVSKSIKMFLANLHASPRAHRRPILKFHSVRTALMKKCDLYFTERWSFVFSDVCTTLRSFCESYSSNWSRVPFREIDKDSGGSVSWNTQPNCRTSFNTATACLSPPFFGFLFGCSSTFLCVNEHSLPNLQPDSDIGRMPIVTR